MTPVVAGVIGVLGSSLKLEVWDGEIPRFDASGNPINPESKLGNWPGLAVSMGKGAVRRKRMFGGQYIDLAPIDVQVWGTERGQEERASIAVDKLLQQSSTWNLMTQVMQPLDTRVIRVIHARLDNWSSTQEQEMRTAQGKLLYLGDLKLEVRVHGSTVV